MYAASAVFPVKSRRDNLVTSIVPLALLAIGGVALLMHLGHPERMLNAFANPSAGIALEGYATFAFGIILVIDLVLSIAKGAAPRALRIVGAIIAVVLCVVMGIAYFKYESVLAWHALTTIPLFVFGSLAAGTLLFGALSTDARTSKGYIPAGATLAAVAAVAFAFEGAELAGLGFSLLPFACAVVLAAIAAACVVYAGRKDAAWMHWMAFALMLIAVVVARYAFYSVI